MIVPPKPAAVIGTLIGIGWNGSAEAARAVGAAMAYLTTAETVTIFTCRSQDDMDLPPDELVDYLAWHGVADDVKVVGLEPSVGASLVKASGDIGINLLVVGGYRRSRLRELILGGVTAHLLHAAVIPVFMMH